MKFKESNPNIPSLRSDLDLRRIESPSTPLYKSTNNKERVGELIVREISPHTEERYEALSLGGKKPSLESTIELAVSMKDDWKLFESEINDAAHLPKYEIHVGKLTDGTEGIIVTADVIERDEDVTQDRLQAEYTRLCYGIVKYFLKCKSEQRRIWWDIQTSAFIYGKTTGEDSSRLYMVDLDPAFTEYSGEMIKIFYINFFKLLKSQGLVDQETCDECIDSLQD